MPFAMTHMEDLKSLFMSKINISFDNKATRKGFLNIWFYIHQTFFKKEPSTFISYFDITKNVESEARP